MQQVLFSGTTGLMITHLCQEWWLRIETYISVLEEVIFLGDPSFEDLKDYWGY